MKKYSAVVVLAAGIAQNANGTRQFTNDQANFSYEIAGDPYEFRFKAVQKLFTDGACAQFILVGGDVETTIDGKKDKLKDKNGEHIPKAEVMADCLINQYQIPAEKITILHSASNTKGNALAVA